MNAPAVLDALAGRINAAHQAAYGAARSALEHAAECGRLLIEAKAQLQHGEWLPWLESHTTVSARQCQKYMRLAQGWAAIEAKCEAESHLTLEGALKLLASPKDEPADLRHEFSALAAEQAQLTAELRMLGKALDRADTQDELMAIRDRAGTIAHRAAEIQGRAVRRTGEIIRWFTDRGLSMSDIWALAELAEKAPAVLDQLVAERIAQLEHAGAT